MLTSEIRGYAYAVAVTADATADNIKTAVGLQNTGTAGTVTIRQKDHADVVIALAQYQTINCGRLWRGVKAVGAGVTIIGFFN